jgi:hypothetical protein
MYPVSETIRSEYEADIKVASLAVEAGETTSKDEALAYLTDVPTDLMVMVLANALTRHKVLTPAHTHLLRSWAMAAFEADIDETIAQRKDAEEALTLL